MKKSLTHHILIIIVSIIMFSTSISFAVPQYSLNRDSMPNLSNLNSSDLEYVTDDFNCLLLRESAINKTYRLSAHTKDDSLIFDIMLDNNECNDHGYCVTTEKVSSCGIITQTITTHTGVVYEYTYIPLFYIKKINRVVFTLDSKKEIIRR